MWRDDNQPDVARPVFLERDHTSILSGTSDHPSTKETCRNIVGMPFQLRRVIQHQVARNFMIAKRGAERNAGNDGCGAASQTAPEWNLIVDRQTHGRQSQIPLGSGLGSSAAAIIAGITLCAALCDHEISADL